MPYFSQISTSTAMTGAVLAALASFLTADLVVYPKFGNLTAILLDAVITVLILLEMAYITGTGFSPAGLVLVAALIALGEWYFHKYLDRQFFRRRRR